MARPVEERDLPLVCSFPQSEQELFFLHPGPIFHCRRRNCAGGNVIVAPAARGQGVGGFLVRHMVSLARTKHRVEEVRISCCNRNVAGLLLYPMLGFQPFAVEERRSKAGERVALIHMRLGLRE